MTLLPHPFRRSVFMVAPCSVNFNWQPSGAGKSKQWDDETQCKQANSLIIQLKQTREWVHKLGWIRNFSGELVWLPWSLLKSYVLIKCTAMCLRYVCGSSYFNVQRDGSAAEMMMKFYSSVFRCQAQIFTPQLRRGPRSITCNVTVPFICAPPRAPFSSHWSSVPASWV